MGPPEEKTQYLEADLKELAASCGLKPVTPSIKLQLVELKRYLAEAINRAILEIHSSKAVSVSYSS
jgi:hypothetical protein